MSTILTQEKTIRNIRMEKEEVNLPKKMYDIQEYGLKYKKFSFRRLLEKQSSKMEIIVTFLCIL